MQEQHVLADFLFPLPYSLVQAYPTAISEFPQWTVHEHLGDLIGTLEETLSSFHGGGRGGRMGLTY